MVSEDAPILFIASYPRSGNTFSRILLGNYTADGALDLNQLENSLPADTSEFLWADIPDYASQEINAVNHWKHRRQVIANYRRRPASLPFRALKTHTANLVAFGAPAFEFQPQDRVLYLVRHPLDVAVSNADYNNQDIDATIDLMCRPGTCVGTGSLAGIEARGSWNQHVAGWLATVACPSLLMRYEDLCRDPAGGLRRILDFIGLPVDELRLARAVKRSTFSELQRQEAESGFAEAPANTRSGRFFRQGRSEQWHEAMTREQALRLADQCGETMSQLGYEHPRQVYADAAPAR